MFGIGPQEVMVIVFLLLLVFGPGRLGSMAKDIGRWAYEARSSVEEFKAELASPPVKGKHQDDGSRKEEKMGERGERKESPEKEEEAHPVEEVSAQTEQEQR